MIHLSIYKLIQLLTVQLSDGYIKTPILKSQKICLCIDPLLAIIPIICLS